MRDDALLADDGHVNAGMLFSNYRELVKAKEAAAYWRIGLPDDQAAS